MPYTVYMYLLASSALITQVYRIIGVESNATVGFVCSNSS